MVAQIEPGHSSYTRSVEIRHSSNAIRGDEASLEGNDWDTTGIGGQLLNGHHGLPELRKLGILFHHRVPYLHLVEYYV